MKHFNIGFFIGNFLVECKHCGVKVFIGAKNQKNRILAEIEMKKHLDACKEFTICWQCENALYHTFTANNLKGETIKATNCDCAKKNLNCFKIKKKTDCKDFEIAENHL